VPAVIVRFIFVTYSKLKGNKKIIFGILSLVGLAVIVFFAALWLKDASI